MFVKHHDGRYVHDGHSIQYPVTKDEALYAYHLCQWMRVPSPARPDQQVWCRRIEDGKPQYCMGWEFQWYAEEVLQPLLLSKPEERT